MLRQRLPVSILLIASFIGLLLIDELTAPYHVIWMSLVLVAGFIAALETETLLTAVVARPLRVPMLGGVAICLGSNVAASVLGRQGLDALGPLGAAWTFTVCMIAAAGVRLFDDVEPVLPRLAATLFGVAYVGVLGSFLFQLRFLDGPQHGLFALGLVVAATKGTDIGAYTFGKLFGRHLMTPKLSPKKTWEGAAGGIAFALLAVFAVIRVEGFALGRTTFDHWSSCVAFALCVSVAGQIGDLAESMLKREAHVKDASAVIPGFGGVLDLLDSLFLAAPVGWMILTVFG